jgi:hypothetical protein
MSRFHPHDSLTLSCRDYIIRTTIDERGTKVNDFKISLYVQSWLRCAALPTNHILFHPTSFLIPQTPEPLFAETRQPVRPAQFALPTAPAPPCASRPLCLRPRLLHGRSACPSPPRTAQRPGGRTAPDNVCGIARSIHVRMDALRVPLSNDEGICPFCVLCTHFALNLPRSNYLRERIIHHVCLRV